MRRARPSTPPVEKVWEFLSDPEARAQWDPETLRVEYERPAGIGTTAVATTQFLGRQHLVNITITDWEPNRKLGMQYGLGGSRGNDIISMEPVDGAKTRLTWSRRAEFTRLTRKVVSKRRSCSAPR